MHVDKVRTGAPGGRSTAAQENRQAKWDRVLDSAVREKLSIKDIADAFAVLSRIQMAYRCGNQPEQADSIARSGTLIMAVGNGMAKRFGGEECITK